MRANHQKLKEKIDKLNYIKVNHIHSSKDTIKISTFGQDEVTGTRLTLLPD